MALILARRRARPSIRSEYFSMKTTHHRYSRLAAVALLPFLFCPLPHAEAVVAIPVGDATWVAAPTDDNWNTGTNWDTGTAPNSSSSTAIFNTSSITSLFLNSATTLDGITFNPGASSYTITTGFSSLTFDGAGIVNNSGKTQTIINGGVVLDPIITFNGTSTAGNAMIVNATAGSSVQFFGSSSAGTARIINQADDTFVYFGAIESDNVTAANSTIINQGEFSHVSFANNASGGQATIINVSPTSYIDISEVTGTGITLGAIGGTGTVYLGSKNLTVGGNNMSTTFSGVISDGSPLLEKGPAERPSQESAPLPQTGGSLTKVGTGTLNLTGANTYTGDTIVNGGTLLVNGSIMSPTTFVNAGGTLGGSGIIGGAVVNNGGVVSPGNSPGTLKVNGNYTQGPGGTLLIQLASSTVFDHLIVGGAANLGGTLVVELDGLKAKKGQTFQFISAGGGVYGTFSNFIQDSTGTILRFDLRYEGDMVLLDTVMGSFGGLNGLTPNQQSVANELDRIANDRRASKLIDFLSSQLLGDLPADFDKLAAEEYTSIFTLGTSFDGVQSFNLQQRTDNIRSGSSGFSAAGFGTTGGGPAYSGSFGLAGPNGKDCKECKNVMSPTAENRWGVFLTGVGEWVGVSDDFNARGYDIQSGGFTLGVDYKVCSHFAVGLMAGYVGTGVDLNDGGRVFVNGGKLGVYATAFGDGFYADVAVTGGYSSYDLRRAALQGTARGDTDGGDLNALFGAGYDIKMGGFTFGPTASFNYTYVGMGEFTEHGSLAPMHFNSQGQESIRTAFGLKASYDCKIGHVVVKPELRAAWQHEYGDTDYALDSSFANGAGGTFTVNAPQIGRDSLLVGAGFAIQWSDRCSTYVYYDGELGRTNYDSHSVSGGVRVAF